MSCIPHRQVRDAQLGWEGAKKKGSDCPTKAAWHCPADPISVALGGPQGLGCRMGVCVRCWGHSPRSWHHQPAARCWRRKTSRSRFHAPGPWGPCSGSCSGRRQGRGRPPAPLPTGPPAQAKHPSSPTGTLPPAEPPGAPQHQVKAAVSSHDHHCFILPCFELTQDIASFFLSLLDDNRAPKSCSLLAGGEKFC